MEKMEKMEKIEKMENTVDNSNQYALISCSTAEYEKMLATLDICFNTPGKYWFATHLTHIFSNIPELTSRHKLVSSDGKIAGVIGIYPLEFRIGNIILKTGGIGSVCTLPAYRSKGIMSFMLKRAIEEMEKEHYDISWLGGDRFRYRNYGWDLAGRMAVFTLKKKDLIRCATTKAGCEMREAEMPDIPLLEKLYSGYPAGVKRNRSLWERHLQRVHLQYLLTGESGKAAYLVSDREKRVILQELHGEPEMLKTLLINYMETFKLETVTFTYPLIADPLFLYFSDWATWYTIEPISQLRIVDPHSTWEKLLPLVIAGAANGNRSAAEKLVARVQTGEEKGMLCRYLLGFFTQAPPLSPSLPDTWQNAGEIKPIAWWMPPVDYV